MIEATLALVILGFAAAGVLLPYAAGASAQAEGWHRTLGGKLAGDLIERIAHTPFDQIVATWGSYSEAAGAVTGANGTSFTDPMYANFSRSATCMEVYVPPEMGFARPEFILATVEVRYQGRPVSVIRRLISR